MTRGDPQWKYLRALIKAPILGDAFGHQMHSKRVCRHQPIAWHSTSDDASQTPDRPSIVVYPWPSPDQLHHSIAGPQTGVSVRGIADQTKYHRLGFRRRMSRVRSSNIRRSRRSCSSPTKLLDNAKFKRLCLELNMTLCCMKLEISAMTIYPSLRPSSDLRCSLNLGQLSTCVVCVGCIRCRHIVLARSRPPMAGSDNDSTINWCKRHDIVPVRVSLVAIHR